MTHFPRSMKILLAITVAVALLASIFAYLVSLPSPKGEKVTVESTPFELSMSLDKSAYSVDNNMKLAFNLRNVSNETVTVEEPDIAYSISNSSVFTLSVASDGVNTNYNISGDNLLDVLFPFSYTFSEQNGSIINRFPYGARYNEAYSITFQPNASLNQTLKINLEQFNATYTAPLGHPLQKGAYYLTGAFEGSVNYEAILRWETPPIDFTIR